MSDTYRHKKKALWKRGGAPLVGNNSPHPDHPLPSSWGNNWAFYGNFRTIIRNMMKVFHRQRNRKVRHKTKLAIKSGQFERMYRDYNGNRRWRARK